MVTHIGSAFQWSKFGTKFGGGCVRKAEFCAHALIPSVVIEGRVTQQKVRGRCVYATCALINKCELFT